MDLRGTIHAHVTCVIYCKNVLTRPDQDIYLEVLIDSKTVTKTRHESHYRKSEDDDVRGLGTEVSYGNCGHERMQGTVK